MIRVYVHYASLKAFSKGEWINARFQFMGQDDVELLLPLKGVVTSYQSAGFTIRKKKWYERLLPIKNIK